MGTVSHQPKAKLELSRRGFFTAGAAAAGMLAMRPAEAALLARPRFLSFQNLHTGEHVKLEYWADGGYIQKALGSIAHVLRDHRNDAVHHIDPTLLDLLHRVRTTLEVDTPFHVISGYRSPESNAKLAARSGGVATRSLHMDGKAIDIRIPGVDLRYLHKAAKSLQAGGVGFYAQSNFVHMDTGRVRYW